MTSLPELTHGYERWEDKGRGSELTVNAESEVRWTGVRDRRGRHKDQLLLGQCVCVCGGGSSLENTLTAL